MFEIDRVINIARSLGSLMSAKSEFDVSTFVGQYFGTRSACMITEFVIEKNRLPDFLAATQNIPDTVTVLIALEPFKIGKDTRCDHDDIRVQPSYCVTIGSD